jgi:hypothetical protein
MGKDRKTCNRYHVEYASSWIERPIVKGCRKISIVPYFSRRNAESSIISSHSLSTLVSESQAILRLKQGAANIGLLQTTPLPRMDPLAKRMITRVSIPLVMQTEAGGSQRRTSHLYLALKPSSCDAGVPSRLRGANLRVPPTFIPIRM